MPDDPAAAAIFGVDDLVLFRPVGRIFRGSLGVRKLAPVFVPATRTVVIELIEASARTEELPNVFCQIHHLERHGRDTTSFAVCFIQFKQWRDKQH